jgi:hypothetical protein
MMPEHSRSSSFRKGTTTSGSSLAVRACSRAGSAGYLDYLGVELVLILGGELGAHRGHPDVVEGPHGLGRKPAVPGDSFG